MLVFIVISHVSGIAIIIVSAASYQGNSLSSKDLFTSIKRTGRKPFSASFSFSRQTATRFLSVILFLVVFIGVMYPNILTISTAIIIGAGIIVFQLYSSVVWALSHVVIVVEESCSPGEAREKAGDLVKGHHHKGFMLNVFINLLCLIVFGLVWVLSYKVSINLTVYGLFFINSLSIMKMLLFMAYTVLYFQCKKHHGEEIVVYGNVEYTKLSTAMVGDEIP
ncbi:hypothetical protein PHJA_001667300 [Phtheirospermum japonicum]|uniref:Uncharacterized protein n=1 Tax=Phtheirospermum japonicum TaxID=374723 RepID=A0A830C7G7_9LAMI|nr:hypothetical protein PHJA_001667300 [Phtheirospermum japonicum]